MNVLRAKLNELKNLFLSPQFGRFLLIGTINGCNAICVAYNRIYGITYYSVLFKFTFCF